MAQNNMKLEDWLDDLCVRFIIHLPREDLSSVARICFQVEEAHWFYEDFIRPLDPALPSMNLRTFILRIFQHCPLLAPFSADNHMRAFEEFLQYKTRVPVRGAILLNEAMDSTVLVKGWKKNANWSFPRGKINKDEDDLDCAIREVYEETGLDIRKAGLVPKDDDVKAIDVPMREQHIRLFVFRNVPMDTAFEPKTRKEISKVEWYKLSELPTYRKKGNSQADAEAASNANKFYMVAPFLGKLHKWIAQQKKRDAARAANNSQLGAQLGGEEPLTEDDAGAHTETAPHPSNGTPAIETMEGATRELQRLLKIQPPTEGLQMSPSTAPNAGKGEALMALLQKGAEGQPQQVQKQVQQQAQQHVARQGGQVPHTPFDHTYSSAPEPHTPHHHHPAHRLPVPNYQPPPNFPIPPSSVQNASPGYFNMGGAPSQMPPQVYGRNPFMDPAQQHRPEPVLLHPQPLPPQVQQSLLTRGILPTPGLPDTTSQSAQQIQHGGLYQQGGQHPQAGPQPQNGPYQHAGATTFAPRRNDACAPQQQPVKPPLTGHAMTLLNTFKNSPRDTTNKPRGNTPQENASPQAPNQQQHQSAPWTNVPGTQAPNPAAQYLPHHMASVAPMRTSPRTMQSQATPSGPKSAQPADSHRSALLDMFKKQSPRSPLSNEVRMQPSMAQENAGFVRKNEPGSPAYKTPSAAEAMTSASEANGGPVRMNPELNLPYRAVQILSRSKQTEQSNDQDAGAQAQLQRLQQRLSPTGPARQEARDAGLQGLPSPRSHSFSQQQMQQQQQEAKRSPQLPYAAAQAASLPYAQQSPCSTHAVPSFVQQQQQTSSVLLRRQDATPEQRQKLLSLFSKVEQQQQQAQMSSSSGLDSKGKGKEAVYETPPRRSGTPRSRVASMASAGANEPAVAGGSGPGSRRGSQTPISPADRSFLLSYLEQVTAKR
ncbi:hypothetical protein VTI74DRAFT_7680 [Chaetomium olivicolor]